MPAAKARQPESAEEAGQGGKVGAAGAKGVEGENLPPVLHKACEAPSLRAPNGVLSMELQPEELLLEAVEAPPLSRLIFRYLHKLNTQLHFHSRTLAPTQFLSHISTQSLYE